MEETAATPREDTNQKSTRKANRLTVDRYFTTPGVDPYDTLSWELRDAIVITVAGTAAEYPPAGPRRRPTSWSPSTSAATWAPPPASTPCAS